MRRLVNRWSWLCALTAAAVFALVSNVAAEPVVDGRYDPGEGYTSTTALLFAVQDVTTIVPGGVLRMYEDPVTGDISLFFSQPRELIDNTYGDTAIGWGDDAPSGKNHNFKDLKGSDKARFVFRDGLKNVVLDVTMDYISETGHHTGVYESLGVLGGDGHVHFGPGSAVTEWASSLDYNFNTLGYVLTENSPVTDNDYTENPAYAGWIFDVNYELRVSGGVFGENGFGDLQITEVHDSPNKIGKNVVTPEIPEPASVTLMGLGVVGVLGLRRMRRRRSNS